MPNTQRPRAKRLPAEERRQQILRAAVDVFARLGYHGAGTADIAAAAEIGEPTIYRYFESKRNLYIEAVRQCRVEIMENWERIIDSSGDAREAIFRIGMWYYEELRRHPEQLVLRFKAFTESNDPEVTRAVGEAYLRNKQIIQGLYERAKREGSLREDANANDLAWLFMAMGAIIDVTHLLGLQDEFGQEELQGIRQLWAPSVWTQAQTG
ncbi:MAG: TetR/AcrR family transcriptional regulator [Chloroflexi bacterium]|nr:TetR/AcrR family transcriptional regulator [Chloroflexota bacterium]